MEWGKWGTSSVSLVPHGFERAPLFQNSGAVPRKSGAFHDCPTNAASLRAQDGQAPHSPERPDKGYFLWVTSKARARRRCRRKTSIYSACPHSRPKKSGALPHLSNTAGQALALVPRGLQRLCPTRPAQIGYPLYIFCFHIEKRTMSNPPYLRQLPAAFPPGAGGCTGHSPAVTGPPGPHPDASYQRRGFSLVKTNT